MLTYAGMPVHSRNILIGDLQTICLPNRLRLSKVVWMSWDSGYSRGWAMTAIISSAGQTGACPAKTPGYSVLQLGEQPCRQGSGGGSCSQAEQHMSASPLAVASLVELLMLMAAKNMSITINSRTFRAVVFNSELDMMFSPFNESGCCDANDGEEFVSRKYHRISVG